MTRILRKITGTEKWPTGKPEVQTSHDGFESWDDLDSDDLLKAFMGVLTYVDIQQNDGDDPTQWAIERDGRIVAVVDAAAMTADQRVESVPENIREEGLELFFSRPDVKSLMDDTLKNLEKDKESENER